MDCNFNSNDEVKKAQEIFHMYVEGAYGLNSQQDRNKLIEKGCFKGAAEHNKFIEIFSDGAITGDELNDLTKSGYSLDFVGELKRLAGGDGYNPLREHVKWLTDNCVPKWYRIRDYKSGYRAEMIKMLAGIIDLSVIKEEALKAVTESLLSALNDSARSVRSAAAGTLGKIGDESAVPMLILALKDSDQDVRSAAAYSLGKIGNKSTVPALLRPALRDEDKYVRSAAVYALGEIGHKSAVPTLISAFKDKDTYVRSAAADALGKIGDRTALRALNLVVSNDIDPNVRSSARRAISTIKK